MAGEAPRWQRACTTTATATAMAGEAPLWRRTRVVTTTEKAMFRRTCWGDKPGRASSCHHPPVLETAHLASSLVQPEALLKQKHLCLQTLCRGASTYASSVRGNLRPPPTPTKKSSDPKVLNHPFRTRGQPLPPRKMRHRHKRPHRRPGRRHWPRAPDSGGGPSCMPLVFWATQTRGSSRRVPRNFFSLPKIPTKNPARETEKKPLTTD